ncbi:MAG: A/G-specific adenine glycosylase [Anaerolineaceae bacterium]
MENSFSQAILTWYQKSARQLPWRGIQDPYATWVSEIMLQQTRVETVIPYFQKWLIQFPTLSALAQSDEQAVLNAWEGLGYYSRARSLLKTARIVAGKWQGQLPQSRVELEKLPGLGRYTAAAIASIAFNQDEVVLDGNVKRVLSRILNIEVAVDTPAGEKLLWQKAEELLPSGQAGDFNQAVMDLGATICTPRSPDCVKCPVSALCQAHQLGLQEERPVITEKKPIPHFQVAAAVFHKGDTVLIQRRPSKGLLGGLWEFPGGKLEAGETPETALAREINEELGVSIHIGEKLGQYKHAYTHFKVTLQAFHAEISTGEPQPLIASELSWVTPQQLNNYPMGKIDRMISNDLL